LVFHDYKSKTRKEINVEIRSIFTYVCFYKHEIPRLEIAEYLERDRATIHHYLTIAERYKNLKEFTNPKKYNKIVVNGEEINGEFSFELTHDSIIINNAKSQEEKLKQLVNKLNKADKELLKSLL
jgi:glutaredoxin 2